MAIHPLQSYGSISMGDINEELGRARNSNISLNSAQNGGYGQIKSVLPRPTSGNEASIGEWRGYNHSIIDTVRPTTPTLYHYIEEIFFKFLDFDWSESNDNGGVLRYELWVEYNWGGYYMHQEIIAPDRTARFHYSGYVHFDNFNFKVRAVDTAGNVSLFSNVRSFTVSGNEIGGGGELPYE
jgi:hypothetical protein